MNRDFKTGLFVDSIRWGSNKREFKVGEWKHSNSNRLTPKIKKSRTVIFHLIQVTECDVHHINVIVAFPGLSKGLENIFSPNFLHGGMVKPSYWVKTVT